VDETVENSVGDGGIGDHLVPVIDRHLAGDDGRSALVPVVNDLEKVAALVTGERSIPQSSRMRDRLAIAP
jgi:hypothetical protein